MAIIFEDDAARKRMAEGDAASGLAHPYPRSQRAGASAPGERCAI